MTHPLWPLFDLRLLTGDLELRIPREEELPAFVAVIDAGIHPPDEMPFGIAWTDQPRPHRNLESYRWWMSARAGFSPAQWTLTLGVWEGGRPVGFQDLRATEFPVYRTVATGSWLGQAYQGRGIGKLMRQAVLSLAFDHLGAQFAETSAFIDNPASNKVSQAIGYEPNGYGQLAPRGVPRPTQHFRLSLEGWLARPRPAVTVEGLAGCLDMFGIAAG